LKRVECLLRVSTKGQVDHNDIPMQRIACRNFVDAHPDWCIVKEVAEKGVSGYKVSSNDRDAIIEIKEDAMAGKFDILLVFMFDRLGRRDDETPFVVQWFVEQGIEVWSTQEGEQRFDHHVDKLLNYIRFWQASGESEKTSIRIKTKHSQMVQEGLYRGGLIPFGYRLEHLGRVNKKNQPVRDLVIDEREAAIVVAIYHKIVDEGYGTHRIANWLNAQGILTKRGTTLWRATSVRALIANPIYTGRMRFGDELSDALEQFRIIDDYYFDKCLEIVKSRANNVERSIPRNTITNGLLTGIIYCAECGSRLTFNHCSKQYHTATGEAREKTWEVYRCYRKMNSPGTCVGQSTYMVGRIEEDVLKVVRLFFSNILRMPETEMLRAALSKERGIREIALKDAESEVKKARADMSALEEAMMKSLTGEGVDIAFLNQMIPKRRARLEVAVARYEETKASLDEEAREFEQKRQEILYTRTWAETFADASFETQRMILASLIDRVEVNRGYKINIVFHLTYQQFMGMAS